LGLLPVFGFVLSRAYLRKTAIENFQQQPASASTGTAGKLLLARLTLTAKLARRLAKRLVQIIVHAWAWNG
jgi:hypothetical protein